MKQKGFTLIELTVTLAIGSIITIGALMVFQQMVVGTGRTNNQVEADTWANTAALQLKKDLQMAQDTNLTTSPQSFVSLTWTDYTLFASENATDHYADYWLSNGVLYRDYDEVTSIVGRNVVYLGLSQVEQLVKVVITTTGSDSPVRSETLDFNVRLRTLEVDE